MTNAPKYTSGTYMDCESLMVGRKDKTKKQSIVNLSILDCRLVFVAAANQTSQSCVPSKSN